MLFKFLPLFQKLPTKYVKLALLYLKIPDTVYRTQRYDDYSEVGQQKTTRKSGFVNYSWGETRTLDLTGMSRTL